MEFIFYLLKIIFWIIGVLVIYGLIYVICVAGMSDIDKTKNIDDEIIRCSKTVAIIITVIFFIYNYYATHPKKDVDFSYYELEAKYDELEQNYDDLSDDYSSIEWENEELNSSLEDKDDYIDELEDEINRINPDYFETDSEILLTN